ncbi:8-oxo-dGTPase [Desulfobotulus alkaliphilus]|uniref:8-oxo-dGTPase n=1 Tax=Desulfobotulus alkaliphilus TaxID=622671 RepID=A0A562RRG6_9BACT|nr:NUDIX domain-containing protein [Desulfobotulus alkaliphilus]TWI71681.1 8-oxo-dGTPase [Desulfobotulus alkaliphilus]
MQKKKFCPFCAGSLVEHFTEGRMRSCCGSCGKIMYENPIPAACTLVLNQENHLLLVKRGVPPKEGEWCLPGGFMELEEGPEETALRELKEETGLQGKIDRLIGVTAHPSAMYGAVLITGFLVRSFSGSPVSGDDAEDIAFFPMDRLPPLAFDSHMRFVRIYRDLYMP